MSDQPTTPHVVRMVSAGEVELAVTEYAGGGPPIVLLHGIGSRAWSWWDVIDHLTPHAKLLVPDMRGHGASDKPAGGYLLPDFVRDLDGLLAAYEIERPTIIGHSLGGLVTLNWARTQPDRAAKLVIEDSPLRAAENTAAMFDGWIQLATATPAEAAAAYQAQNPHWSNADCERRADSITGTSVAVFEELKAKNLADPGSDRIAPFAKITSPTLFVRGDIGSGGMVHAEDVERFGALLPNARLAHIPGGSHALHRDHTTAFLAAVLPFLGFA